MRPRRVTVAALPALLVVGPMSGRALAGERPPSSAGAYVDTVGNPTAQAAEAAREPGGAESSSSDGSGESNVTCTWDVWIENDNEFHIYETEGVPLHSPTGRWFTQVCRDNTTGAVTERVVPEEGVDPVVLAQQALQSVAIPAPTIATSPPSDSLVVHVPTWLWVEGSWWTPYSASATAGGVTATVTAQPVQTSWSMGDGATLVCSGPGTPWTPGLDEGATNCSHTYTSASADRPGGAFQLEVTVELEVTWTSNIGAAGSLGSISRTSSQPVHVGEIQAIETR
jgi:hypothetical protein